MSVTVNDKQLQSIMSKLDALDKPANMRRAMERSVDHLNGKLQKDVTKAGGSFSAMATPGQRRAFWAKVSSGEARVDGRGYVRSGKMYRGWKKKTRSDGRQGEVYNDVPYGPYVQGERQQPFHAASKYPTTEKVARDEKDFVIKIWQREYERALSR
jgi:hypothetical protein